MSCGVKHTRDDTRLGEQLCPDCYDYSGAVLFNALAPELWRRFTIRLRRAPARQAGLTNKALAAQVRVSYAKVAEYQRRGVVHFHAIIRLDGRAGPTTTPPAWATLALLTAAIDQAARSVNFQTAAAPGVPARTLAWGRELDTRPITSTGELTDTRVAAYVAKYATKAAECTGTLDRRLTPGDKLADLPIRDHARRLIAECLRLGKLPGLEDLRLTAWAHMLGFRGHFSTKSRAYSITLGSLRADRSQHQREQAITAELQPDLDPDSTLVLARWQFAGRGHEPPSRPARRTLRLLLSATARTGMRWTTLPQNDQLLTVAQAAELLGTSERFPRRLIAERRIRFVRLGENGKRGHVRIPESALREFIAAGLVEPITSPHPRRAA
jgi:excisionase family DNA binding protein